MKLPSGNALLQFQIGLVLALALVWWVTRPPEAPDAPEPTNEFAPSPEIVWGDGQNEIRSSAPMAEPAWLSSIDGRKPKCAKLKEELLAVLARGESTDLIFPGDCLKGTAVWQKVE